MTKIIIFFGMTASGKSHLAKAWCERHGYPYFNTDVVRKELAEETGRFYENKLNCGIYSPEFTKRTYETIITLVEKEVRGKAAPFIAIDGSYMRRVDREKLKNSLSPLASCLFVFCSCSEEITKERLQMRSSDSDAISDGNWEVYQYQKREFEYPAELGHKELIQINTDNSLERLLNHVDDLIL